MSTLAERECIPCKGGTPPLKGEELKPLEAQLGNNWQLVNEHHLEKVFEFDDFVQTLAFVNRVGALAEENGHHPNICFTWGKATITIWTHKIFGLSESDFILAAKIDTVVENPS